MTNIPHGCIVPMITPVHFSDGKLIGIDSEDCLSLVKSLVSGGVAGIFILGNAGSFRYLPIKEKQVLISLVCIAAGDVPVFVGISASELTETLELARYAEQAGAAALVVVPNFTGSDPAALIGSVVNATTLPLVFYNNPGICKNKTDLTPEFLANMMQDFPGHIAGIKESSGNKELFKSFTGLQMSSGLTVYEGDGMSILWAKGLEQVIPGYTLLGAVPVHANAEPQIYSDFLHGSSVFSDPISGFVKNFPLIKDTIAEMVKRGILKQASLDFWQKYN